MTEIEKKAEEFAKAYIGEDDRSYPTCKYAFKFGYEYALSKLSEMIDGLLEEKNKEIR